MSATYTFAPVGLEDTFNMPVGSRLLPHPVFMLLLESSQSSVSGQGGQLPGFGPIPQLQ